MRTATRTMWLWRLGGMTVVVALLALLITGARLAREAPVMPAPGPNRLLSVPSIRPSDSSSEGPYRIAAYGDIPQRDWRGLIEAIDEYAPKAPNILTVSVTADREVEVSTGVVCDIRCGSGEKRRLQWHAGRWMLINRSSWVS